MVVIVLMLVIKSKRDKWETTLLIDDFVELVAYFAGLYSVKAIVSEAWKDGQHVEDHPTCLFCGAKLVLELLEGRNDRVRFHQRFFVLAPYLPLRKVRASSLE